MTHLDTSAFTSTFWKELFKLQETTLKFSSACHPQTDSQTKIVNKMAEQYLRCFSGDRPKGWAKWLSLVEWGGTTPTFMSLPNYPLLNLSMATHPQN